MYGGGNGSGKSDLLLAYPVVRKLHENPRFKQVFQRRTFPELKNEIVPRSRELYTKFGATFNKTDMVWTFPRTDQFGGTGMTNGGAMIFLGHCENEDDVHKYDSMEINVYSPDELTSFTEYIYLYIGFTRVRASDPTLPAIIRGAGMPGGIGHTFVKKRFFDPAPGGGKVIIGKGGNKRFYVHSTLVDNPHIDPVYAQSLEALPEAEKRARKYGDWNAYLGQVFDEFRDKRYPDEPESALHVIKPFEIPTWWPRIVIGDWGFAAQTYILYGAISPSKRIYLYREQTFKRVKIEEWAPHVKVFLDKEEPKFVKFCQSTAQDKGLEHTVHEQIQIALDRPVELTGNVRGSRVAGKILIHEYLRFKQKYVPESEKLVYDQEKYNYLLRVRGLESAKEYDSLFLPYAEETNLPKLQIFHDSDTGEGCPILIEAIKACSYAKPKDNKPAEDVAEFDGDDPYDTLRYMVDAADRYFNDAIDEMHRIEKQEQITDRLINTNDWTPFYRNMEKLESDNKVSPVSMYGRRGRRAH